MGLYCESSKKQKMTTTPKVDLIKKIKHHFDLNIYESKVWLALINKNMATVGEIAEASGVPRSRVYDVLESLEKRGFAMIKLGKPIKYMSVKPSVVIEHMKNNMLRDAEEKVTTLSKLRENPEYQEIELLYSKGIKPVQPEELSSAVRGRQNIYSQLRTLLEEAKKDVTIVSTANALKRKAKFLKPIFERLKNNGVSIHVASGITGDEREKASLMALSKELNHPIKGIKINARFCIVDGSKMLIFVTPDSEDDNDIAVSISSPFFGKAMTTFLNPVWRK